MKIYHINWIDFNKNGKKDLELIDKDMKRVVEPGKFNIYIGSSSEDIRLEGSIMITE